MMIPQLQATQPAPEAESSLTPAERALAAVPREHVERGARRCRLSTPRGSKRSGGR